VRRAQAVELQEYLGKPPRVVCRAGRLTDVIPVVDDLWKPELHVYGRFSGSLGI